MIRQSVKELVETIRTGTVIRDFWGSRYRVDRYIGGNPKAYRCAWLDGNPDHSAHKSGGPVSVSLANISSIEEV